jgi:HEPN domain-containing protein
MNRRDFQELTHIRLAEAKCLFDNGCYPGAYYLAGYVVECALKACIAKRTKRHDFPPDKETVGKIYTHKPQNLLEVAGLRDLLTAERKMDRKFDQFWALILKWTEESRYQKRSMQEARDLLEAVTNRQHGLLRWLKKHW